MNRAQRNNNPGLLTRENALTWDYTTDDDGFMIFPNIQIGWQLLVWRIINDEKTSLRVFCENLQPSDKGLLYFMMSALGAVEASLPLPTWNPWTIAVHIARRAGYFATKD